MRRRRGGTWVFIVAGALIALLAWQSVSYRSSLRVLPAGMTVAGLEVGGLTTAQALDQLQTALSQPVGVVYQGQDIPPLTVESVEFEFDRAGTQAALEEALRERYGLEGFAAYLLRRLPEPPSIAAVTTYSAERLDGFLARVAQQYDRPPQPAVPLPDALTFRAGRPGYVLDQESSRQQLTAALLSATDRQADLVVQVEEAPLPEMAQLEGMLDALLADFDGIASVFIKNLRTGEELFINADVAYAGMSVLKIALMVETFRALETTPTVTQTYYLTMTMTESENPTANVLLRDIVGGGDGYQGAANLTDSMRYLGLINTFMATPYGVEELPYTIVTPANSRTDLTTQPDPYMQTTAQDMGLLLEMIYQCSQGGGALMVAYPGAFTADECQQMLEIMAQNRIDSLIETGLPPGTTIVHKHGWITDTHADAAIVFSPGGDFVLVIFLYHPVWLEWEISNSLVSDIATATYNYFNPTQ